LRVIFAEYGAIAHDPSVLMVFLAGLAIYSMLYPYPYSAEVLRNVPVVPVDQDRSMLSQKLMRWADATEEVTLTEEAADMAEAQEQVMNGRANGVFLIPEGFERKILRGEQATVSAYADGSYFMIFRQIVSGLYKATATLSAGVEIKRYTASGMDEQHAKLARDPLPIVTRALFNPGGGYATYVTPAVLVLIMQQTLLIGIGTLGGTRNEEFTKSPPPPPGEKDSALAVLVGKTLAYFSIYMLFPLFYLAVIFRTYDLPYQQNPATIMIFLIPFILSVTLLGHALNMLFRARETSIPVILFTSVPAIFLMGYSWPHEAIPGVLQALSRMIPCTAGALGFVRINQMGATLYEVRHEWFTLWGLCAVYGILAWLGTLYRPGGVKTAAVVLDGTTIGTDSSSGLNSRGAGATGT
jgi:ABC-2 type transport system permease protein